MDPAPSFPYFSPVHSVTLLIQERKTMRAWLISVSFQSQENWGECSRFCQSLGIEDRLESRDCCVPSCHSRVSWLFLWIRNLKLYLLTVNFPCDFYLLYFVLLGIEKEKSCGEALIHYLHLELPLPIFKAALAISGFRICLVIKGCETIQNESRSRNLLGLRHRVHKFQFVPTSQADSSTWQNMTLASQI